MTSSIPLLPDTNQAHQAPDHADDLKLARDAIRGDGAARKEFARRIMVVGRILAVRNKHRGSPLSQEELSDLTQETILKLWNKLGTFEGRSSLETWAYKYCYLEMMNALRKQARLSHKQIEFDSPIIQHTASVGPKPAATEAIDGYLKHLSERQSEVIRLKHVEGLNLRECAEFLGIPSSSVKTHYYRALEKLRSLLAPPA